MRTGIAVFSYNRSYHLHKVLEGLRRNKDVDKIYLFQDGLKYEKDRNEWDLVRKEIDQITWCKKECIFSDTNKGLAKSLVEGINYVFEKNDAVIVLEDDCVPAENFVSFMNQCFNKYKNDKRVYSVSGYSWPISLKQNQYDIYGCGRISSWGWGTWKDRWKNYDVNGNILKRLMNDKIKSNNLAMWGQDLGEILLNTVAGKSDSWAVYWALNVIENEGICINPYKSLIKNIGTDGTGVHCRETNRFEVEISNDSSGEFELPEKVEVLEETKKAFTRLYGSPSAVISVNEEIKEKILVYGIGKLYLENERKINEKYHIEGFIDRGKKGWFAGKKIIQLDEIQLYHYDKILIMVQDIKENIHIAKSLISQGVNFEKIILGNILYGTYRRVIDRMSILSDGNLLVTVGDISIKVRSKDEFNNVYEVLVNQIYHYFINNGKEDIVIDVGLNIGDSALYFLHNKKVKKVYGYEPFKKTFEFAINNLHEYICESEKIEIFNYGISNEHSERIIDFNNDMSCGQSSIKEIRDKNYSFYQKEGLVSQNDEKEQISVRKASEVFLPIIKKYPEHNIILKMDCEGEEYNIIEDLIKENVLNKISFIMMEWHYLGNKTILRQLERVGFSYWCSNKTPDLGVIYAYRLVL